MRSAVFVFALLLSAVANASESFRCGQWIISDELSVAELKHRCGEPKSKDVQTVDVRGKSVTGSVKRGTTTIERWTYDFGSRSARYVVTIVDGEIKSIERAE